MVKSEFKQKLPRGLVDRAEDQIFRLAIIIDGVLNPQSYWQKFRLIVWTTSDILISLWAKPSETENGL